MRQRVVTSIGPKYAELPADRKNECHKGMAAALRVASHLWSAVFVPDSEFDRQGDEQEAWVFDAPINRFIRTQFFESRSISVTADIDNSGKPTAYIVFKLFGCPNAFVQLRYTKDGQADGTFTN